MVVPNWDFCNSRVRSSSQDLSRDMGNPAGGSGPGGISGPGRRYGLRLARAYSKTGRHSRFVALRTQTSANLPGSNSSFASTGVMTSVAPSST
jgi:hypothetical protein